MAQNFLRKCGLGILAILAVGFCSEARADIAYRLRFSPSGPLTMDAGTSTNVQIFLDETITGASTHVIGSTVNGNLVGVMTGGIRINATGSGTSSITGGNYNTGDFDVGSFATGNPSTIQNAIFVNPPVVGTTVGSTVSVLLGNLTILANGSNGDSNVFSLRDLDSTPGVDDIVLDDGFGGLNSVLDLAANMTYDSLTINITAVPEPSSMVLAGIAGSAGAFCYWRRRRGSAV